MPYGTPPRQLERGRSNRFQAPLSPHDFALLALHLRTVTLERGAMLHDAAEEIERVYFPHNGMVSLVVVMQSGATIETATIGRAGVIGASTGLGEKHSVGRVVGIFPVARQRNVKVVIGTALNARFISGRPRHNYGKPASANPHPYLYFGCQPAAPSGMRSKKCQTLQKSSPGENGASDTRTIPPFWRRNTETPGIQPPS